MHELFLSLTSRYLANINYGTIVFLTSIESTFLPFPSELIIPPAGYKAAQGMLAVYGVIASSTLGALIGASFNYCFALFLGRKVIYRLANTRIAHFFMIRNESIQKAENYFLKYGKGSTFIGRLVPAIRHLISLPAGLSRMNFKHFILFTILGSALWNSILTILGFFLYSQKELLTRYYTLFSYICISVGILFALLVVLNGIKLLNNRVK